MSFHIIPKKQMYQNNVQTTFIDGRVEENSFDELYDLTGENIILNLYKLNGRRGLEKLREIYLEEVDSALIQFSKSGKHFGIYVQGHDILSVFKSSDINKCFDDIQSENFMFQEHLEDFDRAVGMVFDLNDQYVCVYSTTQIMIFSLQDGKVVKNYTIEEDKYEEILDIVIDSCSGTSKGQGMEYCCQIACQCEGITSIQIFDINKPEETRNISYAQKVGQKIVKISDDFNKAIFSNGKEHYLLKGKNQENFPHIKDKFLRDAVSQDDNFFLVTSKEYDRDIDILCSNDIEFNASVKRPIEPGILNVYDSMIDCKVGHLKTLMKCGEVLYIDTIDIAKAYTVEDPEDAVIDTVVEQHYHSMGFNWPYFSYGTKNNKVFILNAFNPNLIQRFQLPKNVSKISATFLTDTHDLYCITETQDDFFEIFHINLDDMEPKVNGPILRYPFDKVGSKGVIGFHVRGSSSKEKINLNKKLLIFTLHGSDLWSWNGVKMEIVSERAYNFYYLSDDKIFFMKTMAKKMKLSDREVMHSHIFLIECLFGSYKTTSIYEDHDSRAEILNFGVDNTMRRLIILTGIKNTHNKRDKFVTLYDIDREKTLYSLQVTNREIIGRLKSNLYNFVEGHIYYNNKVIKVRYDLIEHNQGEIKEQELFDHYENVISMKSKHDFIQSGTPLQTCMYNRLAYIIMNMKQLTTRRLLILPYLHERKIYLNRRHDADQFYTIVNHNDRTFILCLCINDDKMYIYTETGILCERITYPHIRMKCGKPVSVSEDGKVMLFKKCSQSWEIYIVDITIEGPVVQTHIDLQEKVRQFIYNNKSEPPSAEEFTATRKNYLANLRYFYEEYLDRMQNIKKCFISYALNDNGDILFRIKPGSDSIKLRKQQLKRMPEFENEKDLKAKESILNCSFFYFLPNKKNQGKKQEFIYYDSQDDEICEMQGASINTNYAFFWNLGNVWSLNLETRVLKKLSLYISEEEKQSYVKRVRCGSDQNTIAIRVTQSPQKDVIIYWDLAKGSEIEAFDVDSNAMTFQNSAGSLFIVDGDQIINCRSGCRIKSYQVKFSDYNWTNSKFTLLYGHRVETETNNWIIFRNIINLSFSYMTFVIKENFDKNSYAMDDYLFDIEGYDYVLNTNTIFSENNGFLLSQDFQKISFILKNYLELDPTYLEQLHLKNSEGKIPLHYALETNNNRVVNLLLNYMAKIQYSAVSHIQDIFKDLINYQNFEHYLHECPFQTKQMQNKQTLKIKMTRENAADSDILICSPNQCSYVDDAYFQESMGEDINDRRCLTYATKISCVRADWIINKEEGLLFLKELLRQQNKDVFLTPYIMIVIEFMYNKYSEKIMKNLMPPFMLHLIAVIALISISEQERSQTGSGDEVLGSPEHQISQKDAWQLICMILNIINLAIFGIQTYHLSFMQFKRFWAYLDFIQLSANIVVSSSLILHIDVIKLRIFEAILIVMMMLKTLYFLRLIGEIAPLIDIIFTICNDIKYFLVIFLIADIAFIFAFYSIGRNQMDLAGDDEELIPSYATYMGAINHVYTSSLGEFDTDSYYDNPMTPILIVLFLAMSFFMCIHLLNMLIAIMGDSFANNQNNKEANKKLSQLAFVVDNWWIDPIKNKDQIVYLIAAFKVDDMDETEEERFNKIDVKLESLFKIQKNVIQEIKNLNFQISQISSKK